jgi:hypothetical protein
MKLDDLKQTLTNRIMALAAKKKVAKEKGIVELFNAFDCQMSDAMLTLSVLCKGEKGGLTDTEKDVLKQSVIESLPNLRFYVRKNSINKAVTDSIDKALKNMEE